MIPRSCCCCRHRHISSLFHIHDLICLINPFPKSVVCEALTNCSFVVVCLLLLVPNTTQQQEALFTRITPMNLSSWQLTREREREISTERNADSGMGCRTIIGLYYKCCTRAGRKQRFILFARFGVLYYFTT